MVLQEFTARNGFRGTDSYTVTIDVPETNSASDKLLYDYIIKSILLYRSPRCLPFVFNNDTMIKMAKHFLFRRIGSLHTFYTYTRGMIKFCKWIGKQPDDLINECRSNESPNIAGVEYIRNKIDEYIFWDKENGYANRTIHREIQHIYSFFRINCVNLDLRIMLPGRRTYCTRSITQEELQKLLEVASLRDKVIIGILAVSGLRTSTLVKLRYRHVKDELEKGVNPVHIAVEAQITKGKYHGYSTFLNEEVTEWLKEYLSSRKNGSRRIPAETISGESPLILRDHSKGQIRSIEMKQLGILFSRLCAKAGIKRIKNGASYDLGNRSLRKFFRSQMSVLGVQKDFVEYMMGHTNDNYLDVKMAGVEYLRRVYRLSGISVYKKPEYDRLRLLKQTIERLDFKPEDILKPEILNQFNTV